MHAHSLLRGGQRGTRWPLCAACTPPPPTGFLTRGAPSLGQAPPGPEVQSGDPAAHLMLLFSSPNLYPGAQFEMGGDPNACHPTSHPVSSPCMIHPELICLSTWSSLCWFSLPGGREGARFSLLPASKPLLSALRIHSPPGAGRRLTKISRAGPCPAVNSAVAPQ